MFCSSPPCRRVDSDDGTRSLGSRSSSPSVRGSGDVQLPPATVEEPVDVATRWLHYYPAYDVWVCKHCRRRVAGRSAAVSHFRDIHRCGGDDLRAILMCIDARSSGGEAEVRLPGDGSAPLAWAQTPVKGFACSECSFRTRNREMSNQHSRPSGAGHAPCRRAMLQSWSPGNRARYWIVQTAGEALPSSETSTGSAVPSPSEASAASDDSRIGAGLAARMQAYDETMARELAAFRDTARAAAAVQETGAFIKHTGFAQHLDKLSLGALRGASLMPHGQQVRPGGRARRAAGDEPTDDGPAETIALRRVTDSMARLVQQGMERLRVVPADTLIWLHSIRSEYADRGTLPFSTKQEADTTTRYTSVGSRYLCYCVRMARIGREAAETRFRARFTDEQWAAVEGVVSALAEPLVKRDDGTVEDDPVVDRAVMTLWLATIRHNIGNAWLNPLLHFCAVLAIKETVSPAGLDEEEEADAAEMSVSYRWTPARDYTPMLAALNYIIRMVMMVRWCEGGDADMSGVTPTQIMAFREMHREWLTVGSYSPMSTILTWMSYGKGIREKEGGMPKVMWEADRRAIRYLGERVTAARFGEMARTGLDRLEDLLQMILEGDWAADRASIDLHRIRDSFMFEGEGRSFLSDPRNAWLRPGYRHIMGRCAATLMRQDGVTWHRKRMLQRLRLIERFERALMRETHVWGGQPGRGLELTTIRHADTAEVVRNVFVFEGDVLIISDRDKNRTQRGFGRKVARFLPPRLGRIMVAGLAWVTPFKQFAQTDAGVGTVPLNSLGYVWKAGVAAGRAPGPWTTEMLTQELRELSSEVIGVPLGTAGYRHVAIAFGAEIKGVMIHRRAVEDGDVDETEAGETKEGHWDYVWDLQATHGRVIARAHYAVDGRFPWQLQPEQMFNFREISRLWHRWLEGPPAVSVVDGLPTPPSSDATGESRRRHRDETPSELTTVDDRPTKRARTVAGASPETSPCVRADRRAIRSPSSVGSGSGGEGAHDELQRQLREVVRRERAVARREKELRRRERLVQETPMHRTSTAAADEVTTPPTSTTPVVAAPPDALLRYLQQLYGPQAHWRTPEQRQAMLRIMNLRAQQRLIVVLPTGGGKSVLFTLPGLMKPLQTNIVVVPFVALKGDLVARMTAAGLDVLVWHHPEEGREPLTGTASVVVVSADSVESAGFRMYVERVRARGRLGTIFIDEAHTVITDVSYRTKLRDLMGVNRYGCPVVLLTATLPPALEGWFRQAMMLTAVEVVRAATVKANITYCVLTVAGSTDRRRDREAVAQEALTSVHRLTSTMQGDQKGIVYCRSKTQAEELAAQIGCSFYHSDVAEAARQDRLVSWSTSAAGGSRWIVATSGLGTGIDIEGIVAVIHVDAPWGVVDFVQQTGRGGRRHGEHVTSVVVVGSPPIWWPQDVDDAGHMNAQVMNDFITTTRCRRAVLSQFMDGQAVCCEDIEGGGWCDRCADAATPTNNTGSIEEERDGENGEGSDGRSDEESDDETEEESDDEHNVGTAITLEACRRQQARVRQQWQQWLDGCGEYCSVCYMQWCRGKVWEVWQRKRDARFRDRFRHAPHACPLIDTASFDTWKRQLQMRKFGGCYDCGLVQSLCDGWHREGACVHGDRFKRLLFWLFQQAGWQEIMSYEFEWPLVFNEEAYAAWLGRGRQVQGVSGTNAFAVWDMVVRDCFDDSR